MRCKIFILMVVGIFLISPVFAISDIAVFQGQYHNETSFIQGTFEFTFDVYDAGIGGNLLGSHKENLTTGSWGQWKAEVPGVSYACNDTTKDYFIEILIDGVPQLPRRRLSHFNYLRKDVDESTIGVLESTKGLAGAEYGVSGDCSSNNVFDFVSSCDKNLIRISPKEDFLGFPNTTSIFIISDNESYVGMSHFFDPVSNHKGSWVWSDIHDDGNGGFAIINSDNLPAGKLFKVRGIFSSDHLQLGGGDVSVQEGSAGMDFRIYKDAVGTTAFLVDSENSYATTINAPLTVTDTAYFDDAYVNGTKVCLEDGTNCQIQNISFSENDTFQTITDRGSTTTNNVTIGSVLNFVLGGFIQEFTDRFLISKDLEVDGNLNVSGNLYSNNKLVCLEDGTNCQVISFEDTNRTDEEIINLANIYNDTSWILSQNYLTSYSETDPNLWTTLFNSTGDARWGGSADTNCSIEGTCSNLVYDSELNYTIDTDTSASTECLNDEVLLGNGSCISSSGFGGGGSSVQYVSFISTVDGDLKTGPKYLPLGTDAPISGGDDEASWIIDRDLTITGFLWNAKSNNMNKVAEIILIKSTSNKDSFSETSLSEDIQGATTGSTTGNVSFSQGDLAAIKYSSAGSGPKKIKDLSITLIGTYD